MSTFTLKIIALVLMLLDHLYAFLGFTGLIPIWFTWLGRLSAPIFFFCMAEGMYYTRSRGKYLLRLYLCSIGMGLGNLLLTHLLPASPVGGISANIFSTLFLGAAVIYCMELTAKGDPKGNTMWLLLFGGMLASYLLSYQIFPFADGIGFSLWNLFFPNPFLVEGGYLFVLLAPLCYCFRYNKKHLSLAYAVLTGVWLLTSLSAFSAGMPVKEAFFTTHYQWMMIFALPFFWLYNGKKGSYSLKYLFYLFYPLHLWVLYIVSTIW